MNGQSINYYREDSVNRKVYLFRPVNGDLLQYDFALQIGDTFPNINLNDYILTQIDSELIVPGYRRRLIFSNNSTFPIIWIEGIGNKSNPFEPGNRYDSTLANTLCVHNNGSLVYEYPYMFPVTCGLFNSGADNESKNLESPFLFPNPSKNIFLIKTINENEFIQTVIIFDVAGREIMKINNLKETDIIDLNNQSSGVYLVRIITNIGHFTKRFIKN